MPPVVRPLAAAAGRALEEAFAFEAAGRLRQALEHFERATRLDPRRGALWRHHGNLLRRVGELGAAAVCFERALVEGDDPVLNTFFLSAIGIGPVAATAPAAFVGALFDQYADRFDAHLLGPLAYRAPAALAALVASDGRCRGFESAIDLGCGTGLAAQAFRACCRRWVGVDLSSRMLAQAARRGLYDALIHGDLVTALAGPTGRFDLTLCCDTLIYLGDLEPLFVAVRRAMRAGASFAFTVEACDADTGFDLRPSLRYGHSERYLRRLADDHGFETRALRAADLRIEDGEAVPGFLVHLGVA